MPQDNNYETRLEELRTREAEIREKLRQLPEKIMNNRNEIANLYGVNVTEVDLGNNEERQKLQEELDEILKEQSEIFEANRKEKIAEDKLKREERKEKNKRNAKLQQAYEFFTYLDTTTTKGYNLDGLTEEEILNLYDDFMTKPEYGQIKEEILEKIKKNDREIVIPKLAQSEKSEEKITSAENKIKEERKKENNQKQNISPLSEETEQEIKEEPEVFGPPAPEGYSEYPNPNGEPQPQNNDREENNISNQEKEPQKFNNNSTVLLTEGQILALRNRGFNVPFNKPGQTRLTEEQIKAVNSAGISTVDLTEPGSKTVEELTGMPDPANQNNKDEQPIIREFVEVPEELTNQIDPTLIAQQQNNISAGQSPYTSDQAIISGGPHR